MKDTELKDKAKEKVKVRKADVALLLPKGPSPNRAPYMKSLFRLRKSILRKKKMEHP